MAVLEIVLLVLTTMKTECIQYEGKEFIIAFCEHKTGRSAPSVGIMNYNDDPVLINISMPGAPGVMEPQTHLVKTVYAMILPEEAIQVFTSVKRLAVYITSNDSIVVNGFNTALYSIGGFLALPVKDLGTEYITLTHCQTNVCIIMIVGIRNKTRCKVHLNAGPGGVTFLGNVYKTGDVIRLLVDRFETIQLQSKNDLSASRIYSNYPIGVFIGSDYSIADFGERSKGEDNFVEQLMPVAVLGTFYVIPSFLGKIKRPFQLKLVALDCNTTVKINNISHFVVSKGTHVTKRLSPTRTYSVESSARVMAAVIINSWGYYKVPGKQIDGSIYILQPVNIIDIALNRGNSMRVRTIVPGGNVELTEQSVFKVLYIPGTTIPMTTSVTSVMGNMESDLANWMTVYSSLVWLTGTKTGAMFGMHIKYIPNKEIKRESCHKNQWVQALTNRNISKLTLFNLILVYRGMCCLG